ncbi:hypothetical protein Fmac_025179 [Flemingia macrophylla]|uniref:Uncharacterized protein n=1 Tax=Flemingia macrophylla TaxID=520843 RepID=A0ABD1LRM5_9FABA
MLIRKNEWGNGTRDAHGSDFKLDLGQMCSSEVRKGEDVMAPQIWLVTSVMECPPLHRPQAKNHINHHSAQTEAFHREVQCAAE